MSVFDILTMIGGLALFLYGMEVMGNGLSKASGGRMERILEKMTDNIYAHDNRQRRKIALERGTHCTAAS